MTYQNDIARAATVQGNLIEAIAAEIKTIKPDFTGGDYLREAIQEVALADDDRTLANLRTCMHKACKSLNVRITFKVTDAFDVIFLTPVKRAKPSKRQTLAEFVKPIDSNQKITDDQIALIMAVVADLVESYN